VWQRLAVLEVIVVVATVVVVIIIVVIGVDVNEAVVTMVTVLLEEEEMVVIVVMKVAMMVVADEEDAMVVSVVNHLVLGTVHIVTTADKPCDSTALANFHVSGSREKKGDKSQWDEHSQSQKTDSSF
jgi:hypothetical protein